LKVSRKLNRKLGASNRAIAERLYGGLGTVGDTGYNCTEDDDDDPGEGKEYSEDNRVALFLAAGEEKSEEASQKGNAPSTEKDAEGDVFELVDVHIGHITCEGLDSKKGVADCEADGKGCDRYTAEEDQGGEDG
jgi:hypothetical protein